MQAKLKLWTPADQYRTAITGAFKLRSSMSDIIHALFFMAVTLTMTTDVLVMLPVPT